MTEADVHRVRYHMKLLSSRVAYMGAIGLGLMSVGSCSTEGVCAGVGRPAVAVTVLDITTGMAIARGATVYLFRVGTPTPLDTQIGFDDASPIRAGLDAKGRFDLVVERSGYFPWTLSDVRVGGTCEVATVPLTARLRPRG